MSRLIDVMHLGNDRVIGAYAVQGDPSSGDAPRGETLVVDPGPAPCVEALLAGLGGVEPRGLLLTHVHLDHAGAAGVLVRRFPSLRVYVHERGAPHLADPTRLVDSARRLYGEDFDRLWGEVAPVPEENIEALAGGETVHGLRVEYTPGHASHHVAYLSEDGGEAYCGDLAGVRIPPADLTLPPTPPPEVDLEAWERSLDVLERWSPRRLCLTHFGFVDAVEEHLLRVREGIARLGERSRSHGGDAFLAALEAEVREAAEGDEGLAARYFQAAPPEQLHLGLERYWRKAEGEGALEGAETMRAAPASRP